MKNLILLVVILLFQFHSYCQKQQIVQLVQIDSQTKAFGQNLIQYTKKYKVVSKDYTESEEITLKVFKFRNSDDYYNIHWGQNDLQFLFSAMDRSNPNRQLKIFPDNDNQITSFRKKRKFTIKEVSNNNYIPVSLLLERMHLEYQYEIVGKQSKSKEQLLEELEEKSIKLELEARIETMVSKTHSLKEYSISEYNGFVYKYSAKVAYNFKDYASKQLKKFKDSIYRLGKRTIKSDMFQSTTFNDISSAKFMRKYNNRSTSNYSPFVNSTNDVMKQFLQVDMYDIPRACYKVEGSDKCYWVTTEIRIDNFTTSFKRGVTIVRTKTMTDDLKFYEDLDQDIKNKISKKLKGFRQGRYIVSYQIGNVNSYKISDIVFEKL